MLTLKRMIPIYVLALLALMFVSCDEDTAENWEDPLDGAVLAVSPNTVEVGADGEEPSDAIDVTNSGNAAALSWEVAATTTTPWISFTSSSGTTPSEFQVVAEANTTGDVRTGTATVTALLLDQTPLTITITQPTTGPLFCVTGNAEDWETWEWNAPAGGGDSPEIIVDNCGNDNPLDWEASTDASWLTLSATSGATPDTIVITADPNGTGLPRDTAYVVINEVDAETADTIVVTQNPVLALASLGYTTGDFTYDITVVVDPDGGYPVAADGTGLLPIFGGDGLEPDATLDVLYVFPSLGASAQGIHSYRVSDDDYDVYVYAALGADGVEVWGWNSFDLDGSVATTGPANDVYVRYGDTMYVAAGANGLEIYDIADLGAITEVATISTTGDALGVHVSGNYVIGSYAYVAASDNGLVLIDIGVAGSPSLAGTFTMTGDVCTGVDVVGQTAFVTEEATGLHIVDCSDAANPVELGAFVTTDAQGVRVFGNYAFVAAGANGVYAIDISDPANPTEAGNYVTIDAQSVFVYETEDAVILFVADGAGGIVVLEFGLPLS